VQAGVENSPKVEQSGKDPVTWCSQG